MYDNVVFLGKDGEFIEVGYKVLVGGDVVSYEDVEGEDGEGVYKSFSVFCDRCLYLCGYR